MSFTFDIRTLVFAIGIGDFVSGLLIWAYGRGNRNVECYHAFLAGKTLQTVGWLLLGLRAVIPDVLSVTLANMLFCIGFSLPAFAMIGIGRERIDRLFRLFLSLGVAAAAGFLLVSFRPVSVRIAYTGVVYALGFTLPVTVFLLRGPGRTRLATVLSALYGFCTVTLLLRAITALLVPQQRLMDWNVFQTLSFLPAYLLMLVGNVGFLLLMKEDGDRELLRAATHDALTGLLNRRTFLERAEDLLSLSARRGEPVSLFMMDFDRFKRVNDTHGHQEGDRVLTDFAMVLRELLRRSDVVGRYGGEEFVALLPGTGTDEALLAAERLRAAVEARRLWTRSGKLLRYTVSIGICTALPDRETCMDALLSSGDRALYEAKHRGRNRVEHCGLLPDGAGCTLPGPA